MSHEQTEHDASESGSILQIRGRVHKLADMVQTHEGTLIEHRTIIPLLTKQLETLAQQAATREGVTAAFNTLNVKIDSTAREYTLKLQQVQDKLEPIQRGIYWVVGLVLSSVVLAGLALLLKK